VATTHTETHGAGQNGAAAERLHGVMAEFETPEALIDAAKAAHSAGYRKMDAYTPFPVEGLSDALGHRDLLVPLIMLTCGLLGGLGGFLFLSWVSAVDYPLNVGGRPALSWPSFVPITFEFTVLSAALSGVFGMFIVNGLPEPYHPVFDVPGFDRASSSTFFLCIEATDPKFDRDTARRLLEAQPGARVTDAIIKKVS
jgi:hypothetical protein